MQSNSFHLFSDYNFLEDVGRCLDAAQRCRVRKRRELGEGRGTPQKVRAFTDFVLICLLADVVSCHSSTG